MREYFYSLITDKAKGIFASVVKFILWLLSLIYFVFLKIILFFFRIGILKSHKLNCKVISVGNITWGGTGKTPLVKMLAQYLQEQGRKPAIIIRGYKGNPRIKQKDFSANYKAVGDEAFMLSQELSIPIIVGKNRVAVGRQAIKDFAVDTLILDDGFQHWRLKRDLDIVTIDCANPFGNGWLIPRGILRGPFSSLSRAGIFFLTKTDLAGNKIAEIRNRLARINPSALLVESIHRPVGFGDLLRKDKFIPLEEIKEKEVCLVGSIGNPVAFEKTIASLKLNPVLKFFFLDHHEYKRQEIDKIIESCTRFRINTIITTSKDAVRLRDYFLAINPTQSILVLQIEISVTKGKDEFFNRLSGIYSA